MELCLLKPVNTSYTTADIRRTKSPLLKIKIGQILEVVLGWVDSNFGNIA